MADVGGPLTGTSGNDFLMGDARLLSQGVDNYVNTIDGGDGNDVIVGDLYDLFSYNTEGDVLHGGAGNDIIYGDTAPGLSSLGIFSPWIGDSLWNTRLEGSGDKLYGDDGKDTIFGGGGSDQIYGGRGADKLYGGTGIDWIEGDAGNDVIRGGDGNDTVYAGAGSDTVFGDAGNDALYGEAFDSSAGDGNDVIHGGDGEDDIRGGAGADTLYGDRGNDSIIGGGLWSDASNDLGDMCFGGAGDDFIDGRFGADTINGGTGGDRLYGGADADLFVYTSIADSRRSNPDTIWDFEANAMDRIDLSAIDAIAGGTDNAFTFRGEKRFTDIGQVRVVHTATDTYIDINLDSSTGADMRIIVKGLITFDASDFIL